MEDKSDFIRVKINPELSDEFKEDLLSAIKSAIEIILEKHFGKHHTEEEVELAVGHLYMVKQKLEGKKGKDYA